MRKPKPYQIAEICYNAECPDMPWYVVRTGTVSEQGGFNLGTETLSFETVKDACTYLKSMIEKDIEIIKEIINSKESKDYE